MPSMIKPRTLGVLTKAERRKNGASYIVSAFGMFDLARPDAARFETDQALWLLAAKALPKGAVLDMGMPKPKAELLIGGVARAPGGEPTTAMAVEWSVGSLHKRLIAFGDRYWTIAGHGYAATLPRPFVEMPLSPERAFGGAGHADNPQGSGYRAAERIRASELVALPNVENADQLVLTTDSRPAPALCGPIDMASPKRRRYAGTYDRHWIKHVAPALPDDVDPRLFLVAPEDQIFPDYLEGGEPYALRGFSPDDPELRGALPAFRVRAFLARKGLRDAPDELVEIAMRIDTLWLFAGARRGVLIYRGALPVNDIDAEDLSAVMLAYERAADAPRSFESYVEVWKLRRDRKIAFKYMFSESQLAPPLAPDIVTSRDAERRTIAKARFDQQKEGQAWLLNRKLDEAGVPHALRPNMPGPEPDDLDDNLQNFPLPTPEELEEGELDLAAILDAIQAIEKKVKEKTDKLSAETEAIRESFEAVQAPEAGPESVDRLFAALDEMSGSQTAKALDEGLGGMTASTLPATAEPKPGADPDAVLDRARNWRKTLIERLQSPAGGDDKAYEEARARFLDLPESRQLFEVRRSLEAAKTQDLAPPNFEASPAGGAGEPPKGTGLGALLDSIESELMTGNGATATSARASGLREKRAQAEDHLRAAFPNLPQDKGSPLDTLLAAIAGSPDGGAPAGDPAERFRGLEAKRAETLDAAQKQLDEQAAQLGGGLATMRLAAPEPTHPQRPMTPAVARRLGDFAVSQRQIGLNLRGRDLAGADLRGADLTGGDLEGAFFERADLSGARLAGARLAGAALTGAILKGADLTGIDLTKTNMSKCRAQGADFTRCRINGPVILGADFSGAKFQNAEIENQQILKSNFDGADFSGAKLTKIQLIQTSLRESIWDKANLEASMFMDLPLSGARFRGARLFRCIFLKTPAAGTDFDGADLTRTAFIGEVDLTGARFVGATGSDSTFHEVKLSGANFEDAVFARGTFVKSDMTGANFRRASLKSGLFGGAKLVGGDFVAANLFRAQLRRADLSGARMIGANLYGADLDHAQFTAADLTGVNFTKTLMAIDGNGA